MNLLISVVVKREFNFANIRLLLDCADAISIALIIYVLVAQMVRADRKKRYYRDGGSNPS